MEGNNLKKKTKNNEIIYVDISTEAYKNYLKKIRPLKCLW